MYLIKTNPLALPVDFAGAQPLPEITKPRPKLACLVLGHASELIPAKIIVHPNRAPEMACYTGCRRCGLMTGTQVTPLTIDEIEDVADFCRKWRRG